MKIAVVSHKEAEFPKLNNYIPFFVGKNANDLAEKYHGLTDNTDDNIAENNPYYSELTALYWLWKNDTSDIKGLVHYRRYFIVKNHLLNDEEIKQILTQKNKMIVGQRYTKNLKRMNVQESYEKYHFGRDLAAVKKYISEFFPTYLPSFKRIMNSHSFHPMNMMIAQRETYDSYCEWLFQILMNCDIDMEEVKKRFPFQQRVFGYLSERLLDVWIEANHIETIELETLQTNYPNSKHNRVNRFVEQRVMRAQKAVDKVKRIAQGVQK
ncbi:DUF4422 domain-containing protein [Lactococcus lactis]|uniref:DUF4422 domain-containing protein n=1 Tax=Lactococcus lactis TaxID=1358 RepID=A0A9X4NER4_9LACT|nr:DUF4422 domain-containing protein [Lactococcus lactis]MDG4982427.1 DUF4422 domain-containing protein [Lactococcus lactis]